MKNDECFDVENKLYKLVENDNFRKSSCSRCSLYKYGHGICRLADECKKMMVKNGIDPDNVGYYWRRTKWKTNNELNNLY